METAASLYATGFTAIHAQNRRRCYSRDALNLCAKPLIAIARHTKLAIKFGSGTTIESKAAVVAFDAPKLTFHLV